jgi:hypothetical protein
MSADLEYRLYAFARDVLEWRGGAVDWPEGSPTGEALLPEDVARLFGASESVELAHAPLDGCLSPNLGTDFVERAAGLFEGRSQVGILEIPDLYLKRSPIPPLIEKAFTWHHVQVRLIETGSGEAEYHSWFFRAAVHADDSWEDVVPVTLNAGTQTRLTMPGLLDREDLQPRQAPEIAPPDTYQSALRHAAILMEASSREFVQRVQGRLEREQRRIRDYYGTLLRQAKVRLQKSKTDKDIAKQKDLAQAVELELKRKLLEMEEHYAVHSELEPILLARITLPVLFGDYSIVRRKARRTFRIFWNPILKTIEPLTCHRCAAPTCSIHFLDDGLEPTCGDCLKKEHS